MEGHDKNTDEDKELVEGYMEEGQVVEGQFVDPAVTIPIAIFIFKEACKAIVGFFTVKFIKNWWEKRENSVDSEVKD